MTASCARLAFLKKWRRENSIVVSYEQFPFADGPASAFVVRLHGPAGQVAIKGIAFDHDDALLLASQYGVDIFHTGGSHAF